ncbi:hypothetical protein ACSQ6I_05085 [Anabaena sp. WFMT]|uniref:hypothetical protein n=1 Tax=Anabaena sp. WFMT TaxID=3449730 RepID=UPI003F240690
MVQELERKRQSASFPESAPAANPVFFRTYICRTGGTRGDRKLRYLVELGILSPEKTALLDVMQHQST